MCKAFSCIVEPRVDKPPIVHWKLGVDSHTDLLKSSGLDEYDTTSNPSKMMFARVEITPDNGDYLFPDKWSLKVDERITPSWFSPKHIEAAFAAHKKWLRAIDKILVRQQIVHPFKIQPPATIAKQHINMLRKWDSVWDSVRASVGASVWASSVGASVGASVWDSVWASVGDSVRASVWDSVWDSVGDSVGARVRASVWASVGDSVWDSVRAYTGSFFILPVWKYVKHPRGKYPFAPCVQLWKLGLVPSFDGTVWRLHGHSDARVVFQITAEELRKTA